MKAKWLKVGRMRSAALLAGLLALGGVVQGGSAVQASGLPVIAQAPAPAAPIAPAAATIPNAFSYQGTLRLANGALATGSFNITLNMYTVVTGGTPIYTESFANVPVRNGNFSVVVGDAQQLPATIFDNNNLYIGVTVAPDPEMLPRQRLFPVPWATQARLAQTAQLALTAQTAQSAAVATTLVDNASVNGLVINRTTNDLALKIVSAGPNYGSGLQLSNTNTSLTVNGAPAPATWGLYVGQDAALHLQNVSTGAEVLQANILDNSVRFSGQVYAQKVIATLGFNGLCQFGTPNGAVVCNQDVAETFATETRLDAGDVVVLNPAAKSTPSVRLAGHSEAAPLVGVVSSNPGLVFDHGKTYLAGDNTNLITDKKAPVAMAGRVVVKFSLENGAIAVGDPLTASSTPGKAMKATQAGPIIGYAMQSSDAAQDGKLLVWLQVGTYIPPAQLAALNAGAGASSTAEVAELKQQVADLAAQVAKLKAGK